MNRTACTIVSLNYLPYARTLCKSFLQVHPDWHFYVLLVDRLPTNFYLPDQDFELELVEDIGIPVFDSVAFKYDILELNTNVKPTMLKRLFARGMDQVVYLDPDIFVYRELTPVIKALEDYSIVLTPHLVSPVKNQGQSELARLEKGIFNLGFIALRRSQQAMDFLTWWEERCLNLAFDDYHASMFVDQKWIDLAPSFFDSIIVLKHQGCNIAYWNLSERHLSRRDDEYVVNGIDPLIFFHFSGISKNKDERISKNAETLTLTTYPQLGPLFEDYRALLIQHDLPDSIAGDYAFGTFDNGQRINRLTRRLYAVNLDRFANENPFLSSSAFYAWAKTKRFLSKGDSAKPHTATSPVRADSSVRLIDTALRLMLRILGADRYISLMRYLSDISILRNQRNVFRD
jgi:hypothetical protein